VENEPYKDDQNLEDYIAKAWEMTTKGDAGIYSEFWALGGDTHNYYYKQFMIYFIHLVKLTNELYLKTIMFGFLIAMIKTTYDKNVKNRMQNMYTQRCEMNQYSYHLYRAFPFVDIYESDLFVISAHFESNPEVKQKQDIDSQQAAADAQRWAQQGYL
jgi:hypothetical protein